MLKSGNMDLDLLILLLLLLLIPILLGMAFYGLITFSFVKLGIPRYLVGLLFLAIIIGSFVNIPLFAVDRQEPGTIYRLKNFIFIDPPETTITIVAINVGGAIIPLILSLWLLARAPLLSTAIALGIVTATAYLLAVVVPGEGIRLNAFIPPLVSAGAAMVVAWRQAAPVAYISGVLGTLIGADILHLGEIIDTGGAFMSIGGAGIFDGIFLVGIVAAFLSPGEKSKQVQP